jgi:hypothetical protein
MFNHVRLIVKKLELQKVFPETALLVAEDKKYRMDTNIGYGAEGNTKCPRKML